MRELRCSAEEAWLVRPLVEVVLAVCCNYASACLLVGLGGEEAAGDEGARGGNEGLVSLDDAKRAVEAVLLLMVELNGMSMEQGGKQVAEPMHMDGMDWYGDLRRDGEQASGLPVCHAAIRAWQSLLSDAEEGKGCDLMERSGLERAEGGAGGRHIAGGKGIYVGGCEAVLMYCVLQLVGKGLLWGPGARGGQEEVQNILDVLFTVRDLVAGSEVERDNGDGERRRRVEAVGKSSGGVARQRLLQIVSFEISACLYRLGRFMEAADMLQHTTRRDTGGWQMVQAVYLDGCVSLMLAIRLIEVGADSGREGNRKEAEDWLARSVAAFEECERRAYHVSGEALIVG